LRRGLIVICAAAAGVLLLPAAAGAQAAAPWLWFSGPQQGYVQVPHDAALNPTSALTIELWMYLTDYHAWGSDTCSSVVGKDYQTSYWLGLCSGHPRFYGVATGPQADAAGLVPLNIWTHVAVTYDGTTTRFYINGALDTTSTAITGAPTINTRPLQIGSDFHWNQTPKGFVDEVRLWSVARTQAEIAAAMNTAITSARPGLVAVWGMDGSPNATVGGFTGTVVGYASFVSTVTPGPPCSFQYFVPTGGHLPGAGTPPRQWRSDLSILDTGDSTASIEVLLLKRDTDNTDPLKVDLSVPRNNAIALPDIVLNTFHFDNQAAAFKVCSDRPLLVTSRTYNQGGTGTFGQSAMGYPLAQAIPGGGKAYLGGLYELPGVTRTNAGFVNGGSAPVTVTVDFFGADGTAFGTVAYPEIPPYGYIQRNRIFRDVTASDVANGWLVVHVVGGPVFAWATVIEEATGDGSFYLAQ
jgi:hypothetical protein